MIKPVDEYVVGQERFDHAGTECIAIEVDAPWGDYTRVYTRVPEGHPDFGIDYGDDAFPACYDDVCGEVTFSGAWGGGDWWIGFDTDYAYNHGNCQGYARETVEKLAEAVMARMP